MQSGDTLTSENEDGSVLGKDADGNNLLFTLSGIRQV
jgi:hypothetical protein